MKHATNSSHPLTEDSYFISLSDLMVGLLFIFIIILMAFAIEYQHAEEKLTNTQELKEELLNEIKNTLKKEGVEVTVDLDNGVLHLPESILFEQGHARLKESGKENLGILADTLEKLLPCYTKFISTAYRADCTDIDDKEGRLDTVFVEGHTDDVPMGPNSQFKDNWELSMARAVYTYNTLIEYEPVLDQLRNVRRQKILSVSAYEARRPRAVVKENLTKEERRALNRRIDLRFLMVPPKTETATSVDEFDATTESLLYDSPR